MRACSSSKAEIKGDPQACRTPVVAKASPITLANFGLAFVQTMQPGLSVQGVDTLDAQLRREGWSLHQRLEAAVVAGSPQLSSAQLESWRQIVAPDSPVNFDKRLAWDGLSAASAGWVLDPPAEAAPQTPDWWPLLQALRQAGRDAAANAAHQQLAERGSQQPFVHVWRPAAAWALQTLQQRCADLEPALPLSPAAWLDLADALLERLCNTADQAPPARCCWPTWVPTVMALASRCTRPTTPLWPNC